MKKKKNKRFPLITKMEDLSTLVIKYQGQIVQLISKNKFYTSKIIEQKKQIESLEEIIAENLPELLAETRINTASLGSGTKEQSDA